MFYRLSVVTITLPPLAKRAEDIPQLAKYFIQRYARELGLEAPSVQPEAIAFLQNQPWPGNVRELENVVRQALLLAKPFAISLEHARQVVARAAQPADRPSNRPTPPTSRICWRARNGAKSRMLTRG